MSTRRSLVLNVGIQTVGAASSLLVIVALARLAGPTVQGQYAVYKSLVDVQVALLTLGLPSGFIYVINKSLVPGSVLARWSARGIPLFAVVGAGITGGYLATRDHASQGLLLPAGLLTVAVAATTYYALMRGIVLTQTDGAGFAWLSAFPSITLLLLASCGVWLGWWGLEWSFAASGAMAALAALLLHRTSRPDQVAQSSPVPPVSRSAWDTLRRQSFHSFLQGLFQGGSLFATIAMMQVLGARVSDVGLFNAAALATVGPNLLVAMIAPVLYSRWTRTLTRPTRGPLVHRALKIAAALQVCALALIPLMASLLALLMGNEYRPAATAMVPLLLAVLPLAATRIMAPALQATGDTSVATVAWGIRFAAPVVLVPLAWSIDDVVIWATVVTALGEYVALVAMLALARRRALLSPA